MAGRLDNLKALNTDRWKAHSQTHTDAAAADDDGARDRDQLLWTTPASTGGALFNLANPTNDGEFVKPYVRELDKQAPRYRGELTWIDPKTYERVPMPPGGGKDWMRTRTAVPSSGDDWSSVRLGSVHKYRIPPTSVTRKQGDCQLFGCCGWRLTAAQWIWWLNFVCFVAHTVMVFVTLWMAYWRHGRNAFRDTEHMMIPIYRIRNIPTQFMLDNNMSQWSPGWNLTSSDPNSGLFLYDNGYPINFATLVAAFFATSAIFHFWALIAGAYEYWWFWYWRQLDDAFAYWRWAEYSISASLMAMGMAITLGIREQYALAGIFMLTWATQTYGFLTEYISTPKAYVDKQNYKYPVGPYQLRKFAEGAAEYGVTNYYEDPNALKLIDQTEWYSVRSHYVLVSHAQAAGSTRKPAKRYATPTTHCHLGEHSSCSPHSQRHPAHRRWTGASSEADLLRWTHRTRPCGSGDQLAMPSLVGWSRGGDRDSPMSSSSCPSCRQSGQSLGCET